MKRENQINGIITKVVRQRWLKFNTKPVLASPLDGSAFPHIIYAEYEADGTVYSVRKWIPGGRPVPETGSQVEIVYESGKPSKGKIILL